MTASIAILTCRPDVCKGLVCRIKKDASLSAPSSDRGVVLSLRSGVTTRVIVVNRRVHQLLRSPRLEEINRLAEGAETPTVVNRRFHQLRGGARLPGVLGEMAILRQLTLVFE